MKLKVCGMNHNTSEVAALQPDYLGFIFWEPSKRYFNGEIPPLPKGIKKVGVFVDAPLDEVVEKVTYHALDAIQLHGKENPDFCNALHQTFKTTQPATMNKIDIIKVFSIKDNFDFSMLKPYEEVCDYYLFDTKGKLPGGNGYVFDWSVLKNYPSTKPYFLSGGIGLEHIDDILSFAQREESKYCHALDVNSKFEDGPGLKNMEKLTTFKNSIASHFHGDANKTIN